MANHSKTLKLAMDLIARPSVTPHDHGCQEQITDLLKPLGCQVEQVNYHEVSNLWITHGNNEPCLILLGHTDVVPPGPSKLWDSAPFSPDIRNGMLYGRGAADMKGSVAAMTVAFANFVSRYPKHRGMLALLLTSDEEGDGIDGVRRFVAERLSSQRPPDWCLVGEPSSKVTLGDQIKNGRRGSLTGKLTVLGEQGHVAYPEFAKNPIHLAMGKLHDLASQHWDNGSDDFPATSLQISNIHGGTGADNLIPATLDVMFNFRYSATLTCDELKRKVAQIFEPIPHKIDWNLPSFPFITRSGMLLESIVQSIRCKVGKSPSISTTGGTSDGRFIAPLGTQVVELGPVNATIHKANECVRVADLDMLTDIYEDILTRLLFDNTES